MSLASEVTIDKFFESFLESENEFPRLEWLPCEEITNIRPTPTDAIYYASRKARLGEARETMIALLGSNEECTPTLVSEFARIYSLPTHENIGVDNRFRRYFRWLENRNKLVDGFTKHENNYYMVAKRQFYDCYSRYGFCAACGILRCSPAWCICGHKELSNGWTSNNEQLDEFIKKSQLQTTSANHAYLEWIPYDFINVMTYSVYLYGLPTRADVKLSPLEITDETRDLYYAEVTIYLCVIFIE